MKNLKSGLLRELGMLARTIQSLSDSRFKALRLSRGQFIFLTRIYENPGIGQMDLTFLLKVDKSTTAKAVQKLMENCYITKRRDEKDGRIWRLFPTDAASAIYQTILTEENKNIEVCFQHFSEAEKRTAEQLVGKMCENMELEWNKTKNNGGKLHDSESARK